MRWWIPRAYDASPHEHDHKGPSAGIDLPGQCLAIVALTAFTGAVIEYRTFGAHHPVIVGSFALCVAAAFAFFAIEGKSKAPMLPLSLLRDATFNASVVFGICVNMAYYGTVFVLSLYLQRVQGDTPLQAGLAFLPLT